MSNHLQVKAKKTRIQYNANGTVSEFSFPFAIFRENDIEAYLNNIKISEGYTVRGVGETDGGWVTFDQPPAAGSIVTLKRKLKIERTSDFQESGAFHARVINDELDRITAVLQQLETDVDRAVRLSETDADTDLLLPQPLERRQRVLGFDVEGNLSALNPSDLPVGPGWESLDDIPEGANAKRFDTSASTKLATIEPGAQVNPANLDGVPDSANRMAMTSAERSKLGTVQPGAQVNPANLDGVPDGANRMAMTSAERSKLGTVQPGAQVNPANLDGVPDSTNRIAMTTAERSKLTALSTGGVSAAETRKALDTTGYSVREVFGKANAALDTVAINTALADLDAMAVNTGGKGALLLNGDHFILAKAAGGDFAISVPIGNLTDLAIVGVGGQVLLEKDPADPSPFRLFDADGNAAIRGKRRLFMSGVHFMGDLYRLPDIIADARSNLAVIREFSEVYLHRVTIEAGRYFGFKITGHKDVRCSTVFDRCTALHMARDSLSTVDCYDVRFVGCHVEGTYDDAMTGHSTLPYHERTVSVRNLVEYIDCTLNLAQGAKPLGARLIRMVGCTFTGLISHGLATGLDATFGEGWTPIERIEVIGCRFRQPINPGTRLGADQQTYELLPGKDAESTIVKTLGAHPSSPEIIIRDCAFVADEPGSLGGQYRRLSNLKLRTGRGWGHRRWGNPAAYGGPAVLSVAAPWTATAGLNRLITTVQSALVMPVLVSSDAGDLRVVTITGTDGEGGVRTESVTLNGTTPVRGVKWFRTVTQLSVTQDRPGALISFGNMALSPHDLFTRSGWADPITSPTSPEWTIGAYRAIRTDHTGASDMARITVENCTFVGMQDPGPISLRDPWYLPRDSAGGSAFHPWAIPLAATEFPQTHRIVRCFTSGTEAKFRVMRGTSKGTAQTIQLQYTHDLSGNSGWTDVIGSVCLMGGTSGSVTATFVIPIGLRRPHLLRVVGAGGNGSATVDIVGFELEITNAQQACSPTPAESVDRWWDPNPNYAWAIPVSAAEPAGGSYARVTRTLVGGTKGSFVIQRGVEKGNSNQTISWQYTTDLSGSTGWTTVPGAIATMGGQAATMTVPFTVPPGLIGVPALWRVVGAGGDGVVAVDIAHIEIQVADVYRVRPGGHYAHTPVADLGPAPIVEYGAGISATMAGGRLQLAVAPSFASLQESAAAPALGGQAFLPVRAADGTWSLVAWSEIIHALTVTQGATFNGSSYLIPGSKWFSADAQAFSAALVVYLGSIGTDQFIFCANNKVSLRIRSSNKVRFRLTNSAATAIIDLDSTPTLAAATKYAIGVSARTPAGTNTAVIRINKGIPTIGTPTADGTFRLSDGASNRIGASEATTPALFLANGGRIGPLIMSNTFVDWTSDTEWDRFFDASNNPTDWGVRGERVFQGGATVVLHWGAKGLGPFVNSGPSPHVPLTVGLGAAPVIGPW
jgi:hypothetical protein